MRIFIIPVNKIPVVNIFEGLRVSVNKPPENFPTHTPLRNHSLLHQVHSSSGKGFVLRPVWRMCKTFYKNNRRSNLKLVKCKPSIELFNNGES